MKIKLVFILVCFFCNCKAQKIDTIPYNEFYKFALKSRIIEKGESRAKEDYSSLLKVKEIVSSDSLMIQQYGIYLIESIAEDSKVGIIFKKKNSYELYDLTNFEFFMSQLLTFLDDPLFSLSYKTKYRYLKEVIDIYKQSSKSKMDMVIEEELGQIKYFIDAANYEK